ncbi:uncharacterized protein N7473_012554 [Penicillium subrubescens]|uniref:Uncharacterized protein n=1 Tax=Penicillium subrubescens TaxID=1316194 RepID=A0A1Q5U4W0_9EURO|nr:uncharacterized protein N7473_012554 [Penicillium subrubescens]KAJ5875207.1 hypothetical protein N7473_012554 [Penicillium subrubescens]OKP07500.1 hypothetical protein PENSUB_6089 [Penicillium subrubescens]
MESLLHYIQATPDQLFEDLGAILDALFQAILKDLGVVHEFCDGFGPLGIEGFLAKYGWKAARSKYCYCCGSGESDLDAENGSGEYGYWDCE